MHVVQFSHLYVRYQPVHQHFTRLVSNHSRSPCSIYVGQMFMFIRSQRRSSGRSFSGYLDHDDTYACIIRRPSLRFKSHRTRLFTQTSLSPTARFHPQLASGSLAVESVLSRRPVLFCRTLVPFPAVLALAFTHYIQSAAFRSLLPFILDLISSLDISPCSLCKTKTTNDHPA
jgi:hypothetical protein